MMVSKSILMMGLAGFIFHTVYCSSKKQFVIEALDNENLAVEEDAAKVGRTSHSRALRALIPVVVNTWPFVNATKKAWEVLSVNGESALDAVEQGCTVCEDEQCDGTVGYGGSPNEDGETTLDAMIMDGPTHRSGAVAGIRRIKKAISVARKVMEHTEHTLLVGEWATKFAIQMGFAEENLTTLESNKVYQNWLRQGCQPNFWKNVEPDSRSHCGPYSPKQVSNSETKDSSEPKSHDTIGMVAIDSNGNMASGTSTNGARFKIPGRIGDGPITGSGSYVDQNVGGAAATGDGDVLMRFLPSLTTVEYMRSGMTPSTAAAYSLKKIADYYPQFEGAVVALKNNGEFGAACYGFKNFSYSVANLDLGEPQILSVECVSPLLSQKYSKHVIP